MGFNGYRERKKTFKMTVDIIDINEPHNELPNINFFTLKCTFRTEIYDIRSMFLLAPRNAQHNNKEHEAWIAKILDNVKLIVFR